LAAFGIGAKLRQERVGQGLTVDDISRNTRIARRFLEAIETDDFSDLPGLVFARSFVRQYALTLKLDPDPLLAELPKQDQSTVLLPAPPAHARSSYQRDRRQSILISLVWLLLALGGGGAAYMYFNHSMHKAAVQAEARATGSPAVTNAPAASPESRRTVPAGNSTPQATAAPAAAPQATAAAPVQVSLTAHDAAWVQVSADGKLIFTGTLQPNETKEVSAEEQVRVLTGNAGALTISLNGKILESIGPAGQVRVVKLTAEGPQLVSKAPAPAPDPL